MADAASTVCAVGSEHCGPQTRSTRVTAAPGTTAHLVPIRAHETDTRCSAEKPSVPKKLRSCRSRTSARQRLTCATAWSVILAAFEASIAPWALMTATDAVGQWHVNRTACSYRRRLAMEMPDGPAVDGAGTT